MDDSQPTASPEVSLPPKPPLGRRFALFFVGLAQDYWKDGPTPVFWIAFKKAIANIGKKEEPLPKKRKPMQPKEKKKREWSCSYPNLLSTIWGRGHHLPGGDKMIMALCVPLGLGRDMTILDLSAGMGALSRTLYEKFKCCTDGMEAHEELVKQGREHMIEHELLNMLPLSVYVPKLFVADKHYHCVIARELFHTLKSKDALFSQISKSMQTNPKERGQLAFFDFALEKEDDIQKPKIQAWIKGQKDCFPITTETYRKLLQEVGFDLRVTEDLTDDYRVMVLNGLAKFAKYLQTHPPDAPTRKHILDVMTFWALRIAAMKDGLKYYRFYAFRS